MACPYLEYRREGEDLTVDEARAFCTAADRFVQPMRADICNDRYALEHAAHCEIYRDAEGLPPVDATPEGTDDSGEEDEP